MSCAGRTGRAFLAIRENERAAEAMGVNLARYKTIAFAISALYTGLAGALSAYLVGFLDPQEFSFFLSIQFITIIILGGLASLLGSVLGAGFLIILPELLAGLDVWQALVYGVIMVLTIIFMPFGLERRHPPLRAIAGSGSVPSPSSRVAWDTDGAQAWRPMSASPCPWTPDSRPGACYADPAP